LGDALRAQGKLDEAISHYQQALLIKSDDPTTHHRLGDVFQSQGKLDESITHYTKAVQLNPNSAVTYYYLARALDSKDRTQEAITHFREALRIKPDWEKPMNSLAWILATHSQDRFRNSAEAIQLAQRACELTDYQDPGLVDTLAAAYAAAGRFDDAVATAEMAVQLTASGDNKQRHQDIQNRLQLYKAHQPYRR